MFLISRERGDQLHSRQDEEEKVLVDELFHTAKAMYEPRLVKLGNDLKRVRVAPVIDMRVEF